MSEQDRQAVWDRELAYIRKRVDRATVMGKHSLYAFIAELRAEARAEVIASALDAGKSWGGGVYPAIQEAVTDVRLLDTRLADQHCETCGHPRAMHEPAPVQMPCACCEVEGYWP